MNQQVINIESVQDYNDNLGVETLHPLVSVVNMSSLSQIKHSLKCFGFYALFLKQLNCGTLQYGRSKYDYRDGTIVCVAPGQVAGINDGGVTINPQGWILMFHQDLLRGTSLASKMRDYTFFTYSSNEALHTSERERQTIIGCMQEILNELSRPIDKHSRRIIVSNIELLLNHCVRFYDRQFVTREQVNHDILNRFEKILDNYFDESADFNTELPSVNWFANKLNLSPNYFGDLIKRETGISAQEHIQRRIIQQAKHLLGDKRLSVSQTAYSLGYKHPHHLSRTFKRITGISPNEYKKLS